MSSEQFLFHLVANIVVSALTSSSVVALVREYLSTKIRASIQHTYDEKIESLKTELSLKSEKELERLRTDLLQQVRAYEIRLSTVQPHVRQTVELVHEKLLKAYHELEAATDIAPAPFDQSRFDALQRFHKVLAEAQEAFFPKRIYFTPDAAVRIRELGIQMMLVADEYHRKLTYAKERDDTSILADSDDRAFRQVRDRLKRLLDEVTNDLRQAIGVATTSAASPGS